MASTEWSFNRVLGTRGLCVLSVCVVGLLSLCGSLLGLLGERTIVSVKSGGSKWGREGARERVREGTRGREKEWERGFNGERFLETPKDLDLGFLGY